MREFSFEKLEVWKRARGFTVEIYKTTASFPNEEKFGLVSQLRRASISISSNIAEGSSRQSAKDQVKFYVIAFSSAIEVLNQLILSMDLNYISKESYQELRTELEAITAMLNTLHKRINPGGSNQKPK